MTASPRHHSQATPHPRTSGTPGALLQSLSVPADLCKSWERKNLMSPLRGRAMGLFLRTAGCNPVVGKPTKNIENEEGHFPQKGGGGWMKSKLCRQPASPTEVLRRQPASPICTLSHTPPKSHCSVSSGCGFLCLCCSSPRRTGRQTVPFKHVGSLTPRTCSQGPLCRCE